MLSEALVHSPIVAGEDGQPSVMGGTGFGFDFNPEEDPELALVSLLASPRSCAITNIYYR